MTWPTKNPISLSLPAWYSATWLGLAAMTSSTIASMAEASVICLRPLASMISSAAPSPTHMASKTSFAILPEIVLSLILSSNPASARADTGL